MRYLGLVSLLLTVAIAGWWLSLSMSPSDGEEGIQQEQSYQNAIDSAHDAASMLESR